MREIELIRNCLAQKGMSQTKLAEMSKLSNATISNVLNGKIDITLYRDKIFRALDLVGDEQVDVVDMIYRRVADSGSIQIPSSIRKKLNIQEGSTVMMHISDGKLIIERLVNNI